MFSKIAFEDCKNFFPEIFIDYINRNEDLKNFYQYFPDPENFITQARTKVFAPKKDKYCTKPSKINMPLFLMRLMIK